MIEKNKKLFDFLVPLVAFVVIAQSFFIISNFKKESDAVIMREEGNVVKVEEVEEVENQKPVYNLAFSAANTEMEKGKSYPVKLKAVSDINNNVDAISLYIKYDKEAFTVSNLEFSDKLPKPASVKISDKVGMIIVHYFVAEANGIKISKAESFDLLGFDIVPKKVGEFQFEISTGNDGSDSATMIVDNATTKLLPFSSNALNIQVK
jgi:hypothetical protein